MTGATQPPLDPRHDPIYQRGYQGDVSRAKLVPKTVVYPAPTADASDPAHEPSALVAATGQPAADQASQVGKAEGDAPTRNPYIVALWVLGCGLLVVGVALAWLAVSTVNYGYGSSGLVPLDAIIQQLSWTLSPIMVTAGLLTIVGLLFWHAVQWRAGRRRPGSAV